MFRECFKEERRIGGSWRVLDGGRVWFYDEGFFRLRDGAVGQGRGYCFVLQVLGFLRSFLVVQSIIYNFRGDRVRFFQCCGIRSIRDRFWFLLCFEYVSLVRGGKVSICWIEGYRCFCFGFGGRQGCRIFVVSRKGYRQIILSLVEQTYDLEEVGQVVGRGFFRVFYLFNLFLFLNSLGVFFKNKSGLFYKYRLVFEIGK